MDAFFTDMQMLWLLISLTSHPWTVCWSCSWTHHQLPPLPAPSASTQEAKATFRQPKSFHAAPSALHPPTAPVQHRRDCNPLLSFSAVTWTPLWWHQSKIMCPGRDTNTQLRGNHHLHSTKHMEHAKEHLLYTSKWTGAGESPECRENLILSVCPQVPPEHKEFRKSCGLRESSFLHQVKINWGKQSKAFFPLPLTALNSQKASPGLSKQSLSHLLRTGDAQSPVWGVLSCNPLQGHLHIKLISELHNTEQSLCCSPDPREHNSHCNMRVSPVF